MEKVPHNNVSSEVGLHENISNKSMVREYYEETQERKRRTQHSIATKNYCLAKKNYEDFKRQTKQITKINRKQITGPTWYQELSDQQISVLDNLFHNMKEDFDLATSKSTRRALKALGVRTFIPHTVAVDALVKTELYVVDFLQIIKDYVIQKNNEKMSDQTISGNIKKDYLPEERILMSSILHIAYPCFIKRLNYFLKEAVPEKNLEYMKLPKSTRSTKKYTSPYLEPLPQPHHPWIKVKEVNFHNKNVRQQRRHNKMKAIQLQQQHNKELEEEKKTTIRMNIAYPDNSVKKMFCKPPVLKPLKNEDENKLEIESPTVESYNYDDVMQSSGEVQTAIVEDEEEWRQEQEDVWPKTSREFVESETWHSRRWSTASMATTMTENTITYHQTRRAGSQTLPPAQNSWLKKPFGWLSADYKASNVSIDSIAESSNSTIVETNPHKTVVVIDFDSSVDHFKCDETTGDNGKKLDGKPEYAGESDDDVELSETLRDLTVTKMGADEEKIYQMFQEYDANMRAGNMQQPSVFSSGTGITVAKIDRTKHVDTPSMKGMPGTPLPSVVQVAVEGQSARALGKKSSIVDLPPNDRDSRGVTIHADNHVSETSAAASDCDHDQATDKRPPPLINEDGSVNMTRLHSVIHKLPNWKQLRVVLKLMSIMGDPVASFPEIIELNKLRRWYEVRINENRHMTLKMKQNLMVQSINAWSAPRIKLTSVNVPQNPMQGEGKIGAMKITWNRVNEMKRKIKKTKSEYIDKLKRVAINNARTMYQTMYNDYYNSHLSRNFKQSYYDYFPAKDDDCLFEYVADRKNNK
ncbi:uncharacterized protein LOC100570313 isoform X2 [Acyrthosiphon pisum]|uniref:DUF4771 domain-containing protein n=1 Tax=Acyrthosiphon pisum TaxID=7029 RepID=A0A8R2FB87_ACYPI|nr:uncharacterized protein LOC100570313 isoform X2 [Acyrthosiphon pisum]|eukprot:XP_008186844.1 PREDICTED: uncharacterized protein LOC100570313 isoform X2 [Acyrthosiphon pisum]